jgi:enoyl-CoA hydratase/carnithine racemase
MTASDNALIAEVAGPVAEVTLNRPARGNRLTLDTIRALGDTIKELASGPERRVLVLRGAGEEFCLGREADAQHLGFAETSALALRDRIFTTLFHLFGAIRTSPVPIVAVVQGSAMGFGCALAAACDITLASDRARFGLNELLHDKPPLMAMSVLLECMPVKALNHLVYSAQPVDAATGERWGLVSRVVPTPDLDRHAHDLAAGLAERSLAALGAVKQYMHTARRLDPDATAKLACNMFATVVAQG